MAVPNVARLSALAALTLASMTACSASDSMSAQAGRSLSLSFTSQTSASSAPSASLIPITSNGHTLDVTTVELNISNVELHDTQRGEIDSECEHHAGCGVVASSPLVVTLTSTNAMVTVTTALVPPGTYREIGLKVASVHLVGTYDAKAFDVTVPVNVEREMEFNPPVIIGSATDTQRNVTVAVPISVWFSSADGSLVNPASLATDASMRAAVTQRIRASFRAFRDDNRNSRDDDNDEHRGHD